MTTMRPKWSTVSQLRPNRPLRALSKGAMSSTGARHRPLRSLILLTLLSATLAVGLVPTATAATGSQQALAAAATTTTWPTLRYGARGTAAVEVNLTRRVVYLTRSGAVTRILDASPGKPSTPTPTGSFSIYRRIDGWHLSPLGWMWRPNYFYGGYALHGSTSVPTYAASHGCVRVTVPAMNRAWSQLYIGERLYVYR